MAQFIATLEPSAASRLQFLQTARRKLETFFGSSAQVFEQGSFVVVSWTQSWEPFQHVAAASGSTFIWGHALARRQAELLSPDLLDLWQTLPQGMPPPLEGIHTALVLRVDGSWTVGADMLGLMPVYHTCIQDRIIVGSSPELFAAHPEFRPRLDIEGLAGVLLTNGLVEGRSLFSGVQRLAAGHLLHASAHQPPRELAQYAVETSDRYFGSSFDENYRRVEEGLQECFSEGLGDGPHGLILSGGLDSRLVAGILNRKNIPFTAFSFGSAGDIEMKCAAAVARIVRADHRMISVNMERYPEYGEREYKWNHLANGFSALMFHESIADANAFPAGVFSGFAMDHSIGASIIGWSGEDPARMSFDNYFRKVNRWAVPVKAVKSLLGERHGAEIVDAVVQRFKKAYDGCAEREFQKAWAITYYYRLRYHTSSVLGLHSHWPWPRLPFLNPRLLALVGGLPYAHIKHRRMQYHMIKTRYPQLARAPLDRNAFNMRPIVSPHGKVVNHLLFKPREVFYRCTRGLHERRFYYRAMDFNSAGWRAVRAAAEPYRTNVEQLLDRKALAELLPGPEKKVAVADGIIDAAGMKLLTGFLLWSGENSG